MAYRELGDYISQPSAISYQLSANALRTNQGTNNQASFTYPFRSLFTKRSVDEREFTITETGDAIIIHSLLLHNPGSVTAKEKVREKQNGDQKNRIDDAGRQIKINEIDFGQVNHSLPSRNMFLSKYNDHQYDDNSQQAVNNDNLHEVRRVDHIRLSNQIAANNDAIPNTVLTVNTVDQSARPEKTVGNMINDPTQPADKLVNNPDNTRATDRDFSTDITTTVAGEAFRVNVTIPKADATVYDSTKSGDLAAENVKPCGVQLNNSPLPPLSVRGGEGELPFLRFTSRNQRGCLSFGIPSLLHRDGYLIAVENRHITGRPLLFSLINDTARHVELETYLQPQRVRPFEATDYFILPPLANDGLGYTVYLSNDAIGKQETINDIKSIKFYRIPYQELVTLRSAGVQPQPQGPALSVDIDTVSHPNPAYYNVSFPYPLNPTPYTLVLSQSFDPGWTAWERIPTFPYVRQLKNHVLVNNWENGWRLGSQKQNESRATQATQEHTFDSSAFDLSCLSCSTIVLFFLPQLWQWLGFALLPLPFLYLFLPHRDGALANA